MENITKKELLFMRLSEFKKVINTSTDKTRRNNLIIRVLYTIEIVFGNVLFGVLLFLNEFYSFEKEIRFLFKQLFGNVAGLVITIMFFAIIICILTFIYELLFSFAPKVVVLKYVNNKKKKQNKIE